MAATDKQLIHLETLCKALADRTRLRILGLLSAGEICVCDIHGSLDLPQPTVSRHLAYLRKTGLVAWRKEGLWVHYRLAQLTDPVIQTVFEAVKHAIGHVGLHERDKRRLSKMVTLTPVSPSAPARCC